MMHSTRFIRLGTMAAVLTCALSSGASPARAAAFSGRYVGNIHGAMAVANVTIEQGRNYHIMSAFVSSGGNRYSFTADIVGSSGYGDATDLNTGQRFRVHIQFVGSVNQFVLTANPLQQPTQYTFTRG